MVKRAAPNWAGQVTSRRRVSQAAMASRDLHDGLGPVLAGITMQLDAARRLMRRDQDAAGQLLQHLREQTQAAIADIRRLVYELRPPSLDDLGLARVRNA